MAQRSEVIPSRIEIREAPDAVKAPPLPDRARLRRLWLAVHRYIALAVGFLLALIGLTGSINVFNFELDEWLNPELAVRQAQGDRRPLDEIMQAVQAAHPTLTGKWTLRMPRREPGMLTASYREPEEKAGKFSRLRVSVDPYTAEVIADRFWGETLVSWIFDLHWTLLMGDRGATLVGILGLVLLVSVVTGIYLWWPLLWPLRRGKFSQAFAIRWGGKGIRLHFDLHKVSGIYGAALLIVVAFSGVCVTFWNFAPSVVGVFSPGTKETFAYAEGLQSAAAPEARRIPITEAIAAAERIFSGSELKAVTTPGGSDGVYEVNLRQPGEANRTYPASIVWINQYSGAVLATRDPGKFTTGGTFLNIQFPLHNGEALGLPGRLLVFITGFVPLILYVTGLKLWLKRRRSERISRGRKTQNTT